MSNIIPGRKQILTEVSLNIENHAARAIKRLVKQRKNLQRKGKRAVIANTATARTRLIGCMVEGSL